MLPDCGQTSVDGIGPIKQELIFIACDYICRPTQNIRLLYLAFVVVSGLPTR